jgi:hypothetical protein
MINVVVAKKRTNGLIDTSVPVTLKNTPTITSGAGASRLDHLQDVVATTEVEGATLVYDSATDKYIVKKLDLSDITGNLDGGVF